MSSQLSIVQPEETSLDDGPELASASESESNLLRFATFSPSAKKTSPTNSPARPARVPRACRVPVCPNRNCELLSHRLYDSSFGPPAPESDALKPRQDERKTRAISKIGREGVDPFPSLPIENALEPDLRGLFHHFFDTVFDKLADLFRGPRHMPDYKSRMFTVALTNQSYCMGLITQAQTDIAIARGSFEETIFSLDLYTKLIKIFRTQLAATSGKGPPDPAHIEIALLVLCILLAYNATYGRSSELGMNLNAMHQLVALRGGVHNLTVSLAYVVHVDRLCSTMLGTSPTYVSSNSQVQQFCRPPWLRYGAGFTRLQRGQSSLLSGQVVEYALDTCELLSLYEAMHSLPVRVQRPALQRPTASPEYLYYRRDQADETFATLYAQMLDDNSVSKCVLLAARIVEYPVTWSNYAPKLTLHLCAQLCAIIRAQNLFETWRDLLDVLRWVLFALVTTPRPFDGRSWALACLQRITSAKLGAGKWPDHWWEDELTNLEDFVWSDGYYAPKLGQVWKELESGSQDKTSKQRKKEHVEGDNEAKKEVVNDEVVE